MPYIAEIKFFSFLIHKKKNLFILFGFVLLFFFSVFSYSYAKSPDFIITWHANSFSPKWYEGKNFPIEGSSIDVGVELISNNKNDFGKIINLSNKSIRWYINDNLVKNEIGLNHLIINNEQINGSNIYVDIAIKYFDNETNKTLFIKKSVIIPVRYEKVVLYKDVFSNDILSNSTVSFKAFPFFFNVLSKKDLNIIWDIGNAISDRVNGLFNVSIKFKNIKQKEASIKVDVYNKNNNNEYASNLKILYVK